MGVGGGLVGTPVVLKTLLVKNTALGSNNLILKICHIFNKLKLITSKKIQ